jgi:hypothetical protein
LIVLGPRDRSQDPGPGGGPGGVPEGLEGLRGPKRGTHTGLFHNIFFYYIPAGNANELALKSEAMKL